MTIGYVHCVISWAAEGEDLVAYSTAIIENPWDLKRWSLWPSISLDIILQHLAECIARTIRPSNQEDRLIPHIDKTRHLVAPSVRGFDFSNDAYPTQITVLGERARGPGVSEDVILHLHCIGTFKPQIIVGLPAEFLGFSIVFE